MDQTTIDPDVKALVSAIGQAETGPTTPDAYTKAGASGEYGRYQFLPSTWDTYAKAAGVSAPLQGASIEDQNKVAYAKIAQWKQQGYNPAQIASMWNAGEGKPNAYKEGWKGVNSQGVAYDTPAYALKVSQAYQANKQQMGSNNLTAADVPAPDANFQGGTPDTNVGVLPNAGVIGNDLSTSIANRFQQGSGALETGVEGLAKGDLGQAASGALQTVGAVAGGVGDIANSAFELVPGVQLAEKTLGDALGKIAQTPSGQKIAGAIQTFTQQHPQISGDIAAAINIASVIPMFKGLGLLVGGATDAVTAPLKSTLEKSAATEFKNALGTKGAQVVATAEKRGLDPVGAVLSDTKNLPEVVDMGGGKFGYSTEKAAGSVQSSLGQDEAQLQQMLSSAAKKDVLVNIPEARAQAVKDVLKDFAGDPATGAKAVRETKKFFDDIEEYEAQTTGRSYVGLEEMNNWKRGIGGQINWTNLGTKAGEVKSSLYRSLMTQVEKNGAKAGITGIKELNKTMGGKIEALKFLKHLNGRAVKQSGFGKALREITADLAGAGGEVVGNQTGLPFAGTLAGRSIGSKLARVLPGSTPLTASRLLSRGGRGSVPSSLIRGLVSTGVPQGLRSSIPQGQ